MPTTFIPMGRILQGKMKMLGKTQSDIAAKMKNKKGEARTQSYLSQRLCGVYELDRAEMLILADETEIDTGREFLRTFYPEKRWKDMDERER